MSFFGVLHVKARVECLEYKAALDCSTSLANLQWWKLQHLSFLQRHETCHCDRSISQGDISKTRPIFPEKKPETECYTKQQIVSQGPTQILKMKWNWNDTIQGIILGKKSK